MPGKLLDRRIQHIYSLSLFCSFHWRIHLLSSMKHKIHTTQMHKTQKRDEQNNYYVCLSIIIYYKVKVYAKIMVFSVPFFFFSFFLSSETFLIWNYGATLMTLAEFSLRQLFDQVNHL